MNYYYKKSLSPYILLIFSLNFIYTNIESQEYQKIIVNKMAQNVPANYDTTINQPYQYLEAVVAGGKTIFLTSLSGIQTDININGYETVKKQQHYVDTGYHTGSNRSKFSNSLILFGGTFLTDYAKSWVSKFFLLNKLPHLEGKIPPPYCTDTRLQMKEKSNVFETLPPDPAVSGVQVITNTITRDFKNPYNNNPDWKNFKGTEYSVYYIDTINYSLLKRLSIQYIYNKTDTTEYLNYETYLKQGNKYVVDTFIVKNISQENDGQCGCNVKGEYTWIFVKKGLPVTNEDAQLLLKKQTPIDRSNYFDEFTVVKDQVENKDRVVLDSIITYMDELKIRFKPKMF